MAKIVPLVHIRKHPSPADLNRLMKIATDTVLEIARMDGAIGAEAISLLYVERLYNGVVAGQVKPRKKAK